VQSLWSDDDAARLAADYARSGIAEDLALRVYTSRLLGGDPRLVLHGGGNTSLKTIATDLAGAETEVLCIKGSGWDLATIEPGGLPAVRLEPLRTLRRRAALSDEEMVRVQRAMLLDPGAPNPSVETLLHAFLPHKFIDHTHSIAVLSLTDQPDAAERCADLYGGRLGIVPYIMPGFLLAKRAAEIFEEDPAVEGLVLVKHGIFTFGDTARGSYDRMIAAATLAEEMLRRGRRKIFVPAPLPACPAKLEVVAPILRGACALSDQAAPGEHKRFILEFRGGPAVLNFVNGADLERYGLAGVATPDHTIRTKNHPLIVPAPAAAGLEDFATAARAAVERFAGDYHAYFARNNAVLGGIKRELDPVPRVVLVPGLGLFGLGRSARDAAIAADIAESWVATVTDAEAVGRFESLTEAQLFEMEYWSLEQAKLGGAVEKPLAGQVAVVTGGAGTIGLATARALRAAGAEIALFDRDEADPAGAAKRLGGFGIACDVTDGAAVADAFDRLVARFGGVDIVVSNAGAAWQGRIGEVSDTAMRESFELNFFAHQTVAQQAVRIMLAQRTGGCLLFNVSRQAVSPGPDFGPYGMPKAATLALMRQYALEYGAHGIRSNAVNADGIRGGLLSGEMVATRAAAYGMTVEQYMGRNLLKQEVAAEDVAAAFVSLALARSTTGSFATVDGGNIAAAPR
jgi:rhamnose utilization protein RhaD (predicted bifunctional aldolase and dehydrogenase)/NAD(P)-dependent dehydrogenase (short-subunit alcohol dehydrogenase family)